MPPFPNATRCAGLAFGEKNTGQEGKLPVRRIFVLHLSDLLHEAAHSSGRLVLLLPGGVGVGPQGEPGIVVAQHGGHRLYIHSVLEGGGSEGVPEIVEPEMLQPSVPQDFLVEVHHAVRMVHLPGEGRGEQVGVVRVLVVLLDQQIHRCVRDRHQPHGVLRLGAGQLQGAVWVADILFADRDSFTLNIQIVPPQGHQFPLPQTADQFQIEHW